MPELQLQNRVVLGDENLAWGELMSRFSQLPAAHVMRDIRCPVAVIAESGIEAFGAVAQMASAKLDGLLLNRERLTTAVGAMLEQSGFASLDMATGKLNLPARSAAVENGRISLLTSGSTGTPKLVRHRWETLFTGRHLRRHTHRRWLVPFQMGAYAWYQLVTLGLFLPDQALIAAAADDLETSFSRAVEHAVDSVSATPTFWRMACFQLPEDLLAALPLKTITLGGEVVDQAILNRLAVLFPSAQITHIYASTEAGACLVVKDGLAGFPRSYLDRNNSDSSALRIQEGRLWIRSPHSCSAAAGDPSQWLDSGDLVEVRGDRVFFVGRANSALINVGGNKAYPADIEAVLLSHPEVRWCRVRAVRSPLVGHLPEADLVFCSETTALDESKLTRYCADRLPAYAVPRLWNRLDSIPVQSSLKSAL